MARTLHALRRGRAGDWAARAASRGRVEAALGEPWRAGRVHPGGRRDAAHLHRRRRRCGRRGSSPRSTRRARGQRGGVRELPARGTSRRWRADAVVLSGSLPPGCRPGPTPADRGGARRRGARGAGHAGRALRRGAAAGPAIVKPNLAELGALAGRPLQPSPPGPAASTDLAAVGGAARELARGGRRGRGGDARPRRAAGRDRGRRLAGTAARRRGRERDRRGRRGGRGPGARAGARPPWDERLRHAAALGAATAAAPVAGEFRGQDYLGALAVDGDQCRWTPRSPARSR